MADDGVLLLRKSTLKGSVRVPYSKSLAHRFLIACALSGDCRELEYINKDIEATASCLAKLKPYINRYGKDDCFCDNKCEYSEGAVKLNVGESGSTLRFLLPIAAALGVDAEFKGEGRLAQRPLSELTGVLELHGVHIASLENASLPLKISGKMVGGKFAIPADISSQYISGLLMALPLLGEESTIETIGEMVSKGYIDLTLNVLERSGIKVEKLNTGYYLPPNQRYCAPHSDVLERDWSSAAFMLAAGALMGEVCVEDMNVESAQGDKVIVDLLRRVGAEISVEGRSIRCKKGRLEPIDFDAEDCPDIVPVMSAVLAFVDGVSTVRGVRRLRDKESDRLTSIQKMLSAAGIDSKTDGATLAIYGGKPRAAMLSGFKDHRMAMSAAIIGLKIGDCSLMGSECVDKSYPDFFEDLKSMGAVIDVGK